MNKIISFFKRMQYNSPVVLTFTIVAFAAMLLGTLTDNESTYAVFSVYRSPATNPLTYARLLGHVVGHANFQHFFNNFLLILLAGPMLEEKYGSKNLIIMIIFTALITGLIHILISPQLVLLGASGVVFMFILLSSFVNLQKGRIPITLILCIFVFIGREVADGLMQQNQGVSQITHVLGGLCGAVFGFYLNRGKLVESI